MDLGIARQIAVVTGGSRGIGLAVVRALADSGAHVIAGAKRSAAEFDKLAKTGNVKAVEVDLAAPAAGPASLIAHAGDRVDILVNNVGAAPARTGGPELAFLESPADKDIDAQMVVDLRRMLSKAGYGR